MCSAAVNSRATPTIAAVGLSAKFGDRIYIRPGIGLAIHTGSARNTNNPFNDKIEFGSRILFEPELGIGARLKRAAERRGELGAHEPCHTVRPPEPRHRQYRRPAEPGPLETAEDLRFRAAAQLKRPERDSVGGDCSDGHAVAAQRALIAGG